MGAKENTVLIFGCRNKTEDFYYNYEFKDIQLIPAFSRENIQKVYVQHKIKENGEILSQMVS